MKRDFDTIKAQSQKLEASLNLFKEPPPPPPPLGVDQPMVNAMGATAIGAVTLGAVTSGVISGGAVVAGVVGYFVGSYVAKT